MQHARSAKRRATCPHELGSKSLERYHTPAALLPAPCCVHSVPSEASFFRRTPHPSCHLHLCCSKIIGQEEYPSKVRGTIPGAFHKKARELTTLVFRNCAMEGRLPVHTQLPPNLEVLDLRGNLFTGERPPALSLAPARVERQQWHIPLMEC
jgi:hypothetical protein